MVKELVARLVSIPSVNPELDSGGAGEEELAGFVAEWAAARGLETHWLEERPGRPSVVVRAPGSGGGRTLMLNAHLDTVGVSGMTSPFEPRIEGGRLLGRGAMDMKASLAACLGAVAAAGREELRGDVLLTAVADEEHGSIGTEEVLRRWSADMAIVTEPTDLELHVAHRGFAVVEVELRGRASHTSQPERGVNALRQLGRLLAEVDARDQALRAGAQHPLVGHGSWQPVLAHGGEELFTTPAHARVSLERRTVPGEVASVGPAAEVEAMLARVRADSKEGLEAVVRTAVAREAFEVPVDGESVRRVSAAVEAVRGRRPALLGAPYWTDAALVAAAGIPTVLLGPVGGSIHQPDEWVDLASVETLREVLLRVALELCR